MNKIHKILLFLIIILNFFVRVYSLDKSPPSVNFDEAAVGYNAYSILKTGRDEYGNWLPLSLRSFNDYKPALYAYLSIPFIAIFGLNAFSIRLVSVIAGTISVYVLFLFLNKFFKNKNFVLIVLFFLSLSPWRLHFSRVALETHLSQMFFVIATYFAFKLIKENKNIKNAIISGIFFVLSAYSYHSARAAVPVLLVLLFIDPLQLFWVHKLKKYLAVLKNNHKVLIIFGIFILLIMPVFMSGQAKLVMTRFSQENVFKRYFPYSPVELINKEQPYLSILNNPYYYLLSLISGRVMAYFSPINLGGRIFHWVKGSIQFIPGYSMIALFESIVFFVGLVYLIKKIKINFKYRFLVYWIVAASVPAALTWNWFHPLRSLNMYTGIEIIIALGFWFLYKKTLKIKYFLVKNCILFLSVSLLLVSISFTVNNEYRYSSSVNYGEYQPGGFKEGMPKLAEIQGKYNKIYIDSGHAQSYIFLLFYQSYSPEKIQKYANVRPAPGVEGNLSFNFDKYVFEKYDWPNQRKESNIIVWTSSEVLEDEIKNTENSNLIWVSNAVSKKATAIITKD